MIYILIIVLLLIIIFAYNQIQNKSKIIKCPHPHYVYNNIQLSKLKELILYFDKISKEYKITYFILGGTLLGATRHNGFMSWDDDLDYGVINTDNDKILKLQKDLIASNSKYKIVDVSLFGYKLMFTDDCCKNSYLIDEKHESNDVFIDILMFKKQDNKYILERENFVTDWWKTEWHYEHELFPLKRVFFSGIYLPKPKYEINYLNRKYKNWENDIYINETMHNNQKVKTDNYGLIKINKNNRNKYLCYNDFTK